MAYYNDSELQPVHAADAWDLDRYLFTATAYIARAGKKDGSTYEADVLKALWFLAYAVSKDTDCANNVIDVMRLAKELSLNAENTNVGKEKGETNPLLQYDSATVGAGDVDQYRSICRIKESKLAGTTGNSGVPEQAYADRVRSWLKGAIE